MSWLFSRAVVAAFLEENCLDGTPSAPSNLNLSDASGLQTDKMMAYYRSFQSGAGTLPISTGDRGEELLTWFREASRVRTSAEPILMPSEFPVRVRVCGNKCSESFVKLYPLTSSWKTHQCSLDGDLEPFSQTWPRWGMMRDGECWERTTSAVSIDESACSLWATPTQRDWKDSPGMSLKSINPDGSERDRTDLILRQIFAFWPTPVASAGGPNTNSKSVKERGHGNNLAGMVKLWPTPTVHGNHNRKGASKTSMNGLSTELKQKARPFGWTENSSSVKTEKLAPENPDFAEWLMGWPIGWTASQPLEMDKCLRSWLPHGTP